MLAVDLDGVIIDKPPLIPKILIELLFKGKAKRLHYRFPRTRIEQLIRKISHIYFFRPAIKANLDLIKRAAGTEKCNVVAISSRYSFLERETHLWLKKRKLDKVFCEIHLNLKNEQPHIFKKKVLERIKPDIFVEDDKLIVEYLKKQLPQQKVLHQNNQACKVFDKSIGTALSLEA